MSSIKHGTVRLIFCNTSIIINAKSLASLAPPIIINQGQGDPYPLLIAPSLIDRRPAGVGSGGSPAALSGAVSDPVSLGPPAALCATLRCAALAAGTPPAGET